MELYFEVLSCLGRRIRISERHWRLITEWKHVEIRGQEDAVREVLLDAELVRVSQSDPDVYLYYRQVGKYYLCVICKHLNGDGYIVTIYVTDRLKEGHDVWRK